MTDQKNSYEARDNSGVLFYDAPGVPTMKGNIRSGGQIDITAEPGTDKNQTAFTRITGDNVSGALYPNENKTNERQPDFSGPITINKNEMRVAAWKKQIKNGDNAGNEFLSLAISEKYKKDQ